MTEETTLGYRTSSGEEVNLRVGVHDYEGLKGIAEDMLFRIHAQQGGTEKDRPSEEIITVDYILRHLVKELTKKDAKIDELIEENEELRASDERLSERIRQLGEELDVLQTSMQD